MLQLVVAVVGVVVREGIAVVVAAAVDFVVVEGVVAAADVAEPEQQLGLLLLPLSINQTNKSLLFSL